MAPKNLICIALMLAIMASCIMAGCSKDKKTFVGHEGKREEAVHCLFETFDKEVLTTAHLDCIWPLLPPIFRSQAGDNSNNILDSCDNPKTGIFTEAKLLANECTCVQNLGWATKLNVLCKFLVRNGTILERCRNADVS